MKLYIANVSQQVQNINYRLVEMNGVKSQVIDIGQQVTVAGTMDLTSHQVEGVIEQLTPYGLIRADEVKSGKSYSGLIYQVDRRISYETMRDAMGLNRNVLVDRGRKIREESAVAVNNALAQDGGASPDVLEMSVQEEKRGSGFDLSEDPINEGIRVTSHGEAPPRRGRPPKVR